jgi:putative transposase
MGRHRIRALMRLNGVRPVWRRKFVHTTHSKHTMAVLPNLLDRQFEQALPNRVWVCDVTYIRTKSGWLYLAAVLDLHWRKVVGWAMSSAMPAGLVCAALQMAIVQRNPARGLLAHSDRGTQYASAEHQALLAKHGLVGSMSRKGNCWDNAVMERVWQNDYANHLEATNDVADYIVGFYNSIGLHSKLGNMSPNAVERESTTKQSIKLSEIT